ncbi:MAG: HAD family phosphatase [Prolixibacteraceae bacterium]|nr:HAD family phosphatase [Prolixibacteraceae bacterium]MBN2775736.1 HAD family phosphatase [Prolixibacteraceae bacterium]
MPFAVIFDLDGTIVDNAEFHKKAWGEFCNLYKVPFSDQIFNTVFFGKTNQQVLPELFGRKFTTSEVATLSEEKEIIYRKIYQEEMKPVNGLIPFLKDLKENNIQIALATSAPPGNVNLVLSGLNIKEYFSVIVDDTMVVKGKPDPEIFLKASALLKREPSDCVVFEDSLAGTKAAFDAGCKVIAVTTSLNASEHKYYHNIINDYSNISTNFIRLKL